MIQRIVLDPGPVTLVGAGEVYPGDLETALAQAPQVVAADGGAARVLAAGQKPRVVIGDFDSLAPDTRALLSPDSLMQVTEQDSTDFEKAMARIDAPLVIGVGFTGARMDHFLAVLHGMLRFAHKPVVLLAEREVILLVPRVFQIALAAETIVSLFPLVAVQGRSTGLVWPIEGLKFAPGALIGTSNAASGGLMRLEVDGPGLALMLPKALCADVIQALLSDAPKPVPWPARA